MAGGPTAHHVWLQRPIDSRRDHARGNPKAANAVTLLLYGDYLCPFCRRLRPVIRQLREALGDRLVYVFRHFPNEQTHPGATFIARVAEAAARQNRFFDVHDWLYDNPAPSRDELLDHVRSLGIDMERFQHDLEDIETLRRVDEDIAWGRENGVTGTPTIFIEGQRYDGAWDFYAMLEALEQPVAARVGRSARAFASLPASGGIALLIAAFLALLWANSPFGALYRGFVSTQIGIGVRHALLLMPVRDWTSEGLLTLFFLLVGLEVRREITSGSLADPRAIALPVIAAVAGSLVPAGLYLLLNRGPTANGWSVPTATDIAFALGVLALFGSRIPASLRVFIAAFAVVDDIFSVLTLAVFYPKSFSIVWGAAALAVAALLYLLNRSRVYAAWPYVVVASLLWLCLHFAGIHGALTGVILAAVLPAWPSPSASPLLAQAATALATLEEHTREREKETPAERSVGEAVWDWASRNLSAATARLAPPAERIERAVSPWTAYLILPLFAFTATGISLHLDLTAPDALNVLVGVILGLVVGKPLGIGLASLLAVWSGIAIAPRGVNGWRFLGAACLCGIGDTVSLLLADQAFPAGPAAAVAKVGVLIGSILAAALGAGILALATRSISNDPSAMPREGLSA